MKLSELIIELQQELQKHGDMPLVGYDSCSEPYWGYVGHRVETSKARTYADGSTYVFSAHGDGPTGAYVDLPAGKKYMVIG